MKTSKFAFEIIWPLDAIYTQWSKIKNFLWKLNYHTSAIITRGLYIFHPIFHCGLYSRAVYNAEQLTFHGCCFSSNQVSKKIESSWNGRNFIISLLSKNEICTIYFWRQETGSFSNEIYKNISLWVCYWTELSLLSERPAASPENTVWQQWGWHSRFWVIPPPPLLFYSHIWVWKTFWYCLY